MRLESPFNLVYMKASARVLLQSDFNNANAHMTQMGQQGAPAQSCETLEEFLLSGYNYD